ncbi:GyrI-like domain-containing protein [Ferrimonas marina]|uniref:GyrI-like small molecule binding domain-containing protein n=1 Tax=Ferrimonas marina TaxID=299255 RepID=A0A1M5NM95_9GAMM|nr:GyrI-like domain-containing protein [Ferrimonas marina]SHG90063.1 hypothetical protein SAMN02745129_1093 [Ferrimonas marina]
MAGTSEKRDYKKLLKPLYHGSATKLATLEVPTLHYLMVGGQGAPGCETHQQAIEALFSVAYAIKFLVKRGELGIDYGVLPLEGLWWADEMADFVNGNRDNWRWTMMIMQPDLVDESLVEQAMAQVRAKKALPALPLVRYAPYSEGLCAQTLHVGPFAEEGPTVARLHAYIEQQGSQLRGKHHEIYLSDFRRTAPERLKTLIRQPMVPPQR